MAVDCRVVVVVVVIGVVNAPFHVSRNILNLITAFNKNRLPRGLGVVLRPYGVQIMEYRMLLRRLLRCHISRQENPRERFRDIVDKPEHDTGRTNEVEGRNHDVRAQIWYEYGLSNGNM